MKLFKVMKDGGPESRVHGFWLVEMKSLFSIVILRFSDGARDSWHTHAFNAFSWVLKGELKEEPLNGQNNIYKPSLKPIYTPREMFHKVSSKGTTWAISFRGPWSKTWREFLPDEQKFITLTNGRKVVA